MSNPSQMLQAMQLITDSKRNQQLQTPQRMSAIALAAQNGCVPLDSLKPLPVLLQAMTLLLNQSRYANLHSEYSQETFLTGFAKASNKNLHGLETMDEQLTALMGTDDNEIGEFIDGVLNELALPKTKQMALDLVAMWRSTDLEKLNNYYVWCDCINTPAEKKLMARLLDARNQVMLQRALALHDQYQGGLFIGVGSLHLIGSTGLISSLAAAGFALERVY